MNQRNTEESNENMESKYTSLPQPHELSIYEKEDAMGSYLMMFAAWAVGLPLPTINIIAAVIYHFINAKKSKFVRFHSLQSMLSQIMIGAINAVCIFWGVSLFFLEKPLFKTDIVNNPFLGFLITAILLNLIYFALSVVSAIKAKKGLLFYMPLFGTFAYHQVFKKKQKNKSTSTIRNQPPF